jgi:hypothetical protein
MSDPTITINYTKDSTWGYNWWIENRESNTESRKVAFRRAKVSNLFGGAVSGLHKGIFQLLRPVTDAKGLARQLQQVHCSAHSCLK